MRFTSAVVTASVTLIQLVQASDGKTDQPPLATLSAKLGGATARQCNPHVLAPSPSAPASGNPSAAGPGTTAKPTRSPCDAACTTSAKSNIEVR